MIFESHAHYSRYNYNNEFGVWSMDGDKYTVERFTRESLICRLKQNGFEGVIEPSVDFEAIPAQIEFAGKYPDFVHIAIGVHPTRCFDTKWKNRRRLEEYAIKSGAVAIGETGLDYHYKRIKQHRFIQKMWFIYQIKLADRLKLPLILHIRMADRNALKILKKYKKLLHGGVAHCFGGDLETAREYISLGFAVGIGGFIINRDECAERLCRAAKQIPLSQIVVETDSPYLPPEQAGSEMSKKQRGKIRNSSLIMPAVVKKIAEIKGISADEVENATSENIRRIFGIGGESNV